MTKSTLSRRAFLQRAAVVGAVGASTGLLIACGGGGDAPSDAVGTTGDQAGDGSSLSCADSPDLTDVERQTRTALKYVEVSEVADQDCANCVQFEPGAEGACGLCKVMPGPVNPIGHCSVWAAKPS